LPPNSISVALTQTATAFDANQSDALTATVTGDPGDKGVLWTLECPSGMIAGSCGSMASASSPSGGANKYTAPGNVRAVMKVLIQAASAADHQKVATVQLTINPLLMLVSPAPAQPTAGAVGVGFSLDLTQYVRGGTAPVTWSIKSGALPAGLKLEASGTIDGTPTAVTPATALVFTVADSGQPSISVNVDVSLAIDAVLPVSITSGSPPNGTVGVPYGVGHLVRICPFCGYRTVYSFDLHASGGTPPYTWDWAPTRGSLLPPGLGLGHAYFFATSIFGTPTLPGTYGFIVTVTDSEIPATHSSANYTIVIQP
jgi:hypothetical protein